MRAAGKAEHGSQRHRNGRLPCGRRGPRSSLDTAATIPLLQAILSPTDTECAPQAKLNTEANGIETADFLAGDAAPGLLWILLLLYHNYRQY